jgi:glycosyltransferase involved in cell wall biosynthesis
MILNCMLGSGFGGLEKLFLDEIEMLLQSGMPARGLVRGNSPLASYARVRNLPFDTSLVLSDWDPLSVAFARRIVRRHSPTLLMCVGRLAHRLLARAVGTRIPIVVMVQKRRFDHDLPYAGVLAAAEHRRRTLIEDGVPPEKIEVIPNAVRLPAQSKSDYRLDRESALKIVALGRLHPKKGFGVLVEAISLLRRNGVDCLCTIAGEGPERVLIQSQIEREGLTEKVRLAGWTDNVADFLAGGDIFALPSFQEDFPLAVLDGMASGMPIVASAIDGPKDFLEDGKTALLVPPDEPQALARAIEQLRRDADLRERLGRAARAAAVQRYGFSAIGTRLSVALGNVLAGRSISGAMPAGPVG